MDSCTVGWICALPLEMAAARAVLDEDRGRPLEQAVSDRYNYRLGRIGEHDVLIACLPAGVYGTTSAASVAVQMLASFPSIRIGLMVGIGGGVPSEEINLRLGDVVVSKPGRHSGGVIQYDMGKNLAGTFVQSRRQPRSRPSAWRESHHGIPAGDGEEASAHAAGVLPLAGSGE
ncbi:hypothetical protein VTN96DRAFT_1834 [Rasamsonia emersonii]